jgi:hypothetical protein
MTTCLSKLKSDSLCELKSYNVTVDKCLVGLVLSLVGWQQNFNFNFLASKKIRKGEKRTISSF